MSTENDVARSLRSWLRENRHEDADRVLGAVFDQVPTTPQRSASWLARRFPFMNSNIARYGIAAAAVVLAIIIGINFLPGPNVGSDPEPTASPTPTQSAGGSPTVLPLAEQPLDAGTYSLGTSFPVGITFEVGEGWRSCSVGEGDQGICLPGETGVGVAFLIIDNVVADACDSSRQLLDPPVGPSVDDLVAAISSLDGFVATAATDVTVDGFQGKQFTVTAPEIEGCGATWVVAERINGVGPGEANEMRILDVDGVRVVISRAYFPEATEQQLSALDSVIASIQIQP